jgi:ABC-2 type transport system permease protein
MAIVGEMPGAATVRGGWLSSLARTQYSALAAMRWSMFRHGLRSTKGAVELGARALIILIYSVMGLGLATGLGAGSYAIARHNHWGLFPIMMWAVFILWQVVPVSLASFQQQFDLGGLLRFPVSFGAFYLLHLVFGLIDVSTIMGGFCCLGIGLGITLARPELFGWVALSLTVFAAFNIFLVRAIFAWIDRWLAQRRTREIVSAVFLLLMLSMNFLNPAFRGNSKGSPISANTRAVGARYLGIASRVQRWLPPGLAARGLRSGAHADPIDATENLGLLGLYVVAAGGVLGFRLRSEYRGENLGEAPSRRKVEKRTGQWILDGSGPIAAVMEKELRTLLRALPLLYGLGAPLIMVFIFSGLYRNSGSSTLGRIPFGLLLCLAYAMVGFTQLLYNNLGTEGAGIQILFLSPTPIRTIFLAKNMFHALLFAVDAILVCVLSSLRYGAPTLMALAAIGAWLLFVLPVHLTVGNAFSLMMPYRVNMGRISRQKGSQANALLSLVAQIGALLIGAAVFALCAFLDRLWLAVPIFLAMALVSISTWFRLLPKFDAMANERRDALIETLVKTE